MYTSYTIFLFESLVVFCVVQTRLGVLGLTTTATTSSLVTASPVHPAPARPASVTSAQRRQPRRVARSAASTPTAWPTRTSARLTAARRGVSTASARRTQRTV